MLGFDLGGEVVSSNNLALQDIITSTSPPTHHHVVVVTVVCRCSSPGAASLLSLPRAPVRHRDGCEHCVRPGAVLHSGRLHEGGEACIFVCVEQI